MKNPTKKQRQKIYLQVAENIQLGRDSFVCNGIMFRDIYNGKTPRIVYNRPNQNTFPELFMFKDFDRGAWLTKENNKAFDYGKEREFRVLVLLICAEMCN